MSELLALTANGSRRVVEEPSERDLALAASDGARIEEDEAWLVVTEGREARMVDPAWEVES